jgi:CubicO group peptidase (beta-lactamase class C family)
MSENGMRYLLLAAAVLAACGDPDIEGQPRLDEGVQTAREAVENGLRHLVVFEGERLETFSIADRMRHYNVPGVSFALIDDGEIAWAATYGRLHAGGDDPVVETTLFQAGSIAKPVTAFAAMRMREAGLIDLDADVGTYLSSFSLPDGAQTPDNPVTFRHLLSHTAGTTPGGYGGYEQGQPLPSDAQILMGEEPANTDAIAVLTAPGSELVYSGAGYTLAELALQDLTGSSFSDIMNEWVFEPLGLPSATFEMPLPEARHGETAQAHDVSGAVVEGGWRNHPEQAAAGLWATSTDLARFLVELHDGYHGRSELLSQETVRELFTEQMDGHAFGWVLRGESFVGHGGGTVGYRAYMLISPESGDGAVILTNGDRGTSLASEVLRAASDSYGWSTYLPREVARVELAEEDLVEFSGRYDFGDDVFVGVEYDAESGSLTAVFPNGDRYELTATGPQSFIHAADGTTLEFGQADGEMTMTIYGSTGVRVVD